MSGCKREYLIKFSYLFLSAVIIALSAGCKKDAAETEIELLHSYLNENDIEAKPRPGGWYYLESGFSGIESINAPYPAKGDTVVVSYKGYLLADTSVVFDQKTINDPMYYVYKTSDVIPGWEKGIGLMKKGITAQFIIPSDLAYGKQQTGIIPPYSTLIFDVRVLDIKK